MKPTSFLFTCLLSLSTFPILAQEFEGIVTIKSLNEEGLNATFTIDNNYVLMEAKAEEGTIQLFSNNTSGDFYMISNGSEGKMAIKQNMNSPMMQQAMGQIKMHENTDKDDYHIEVTKETKLISGYKCVKVIGSNDEAEGYAWIAKDLKINLDDLMPMAKMRQKKSMNQKMEEALGQSGFIMELYLSLIHISEPTRPY